MTDPGLWPIAVIAAFVAGLIARGFHRNRGFAALIKLSDEHKRLYDQGITERSRLCSRVSELSLDLGEARNDLETLRSTSPVVLPESDAVTYLEAQLAFQKAEIQALSRAKADQHLEAQRRLERADEAHKLIERQCRKLEDELTEALATIVILQGELAKEGA